MYPFLIDTEILGMKIVVPTGIVFAFLAIILATGLYFLLLPDKKRWSAHLVLLAVVLAGALVGARVTQIILDLAGLRGSNPVQIISNAGATITGGILGGGAAALVFQIFDRKKIVTRQTLDLLSVVFPAGDAILRIGCFFNGCCFGKIDESFPLTVTYPLDWIMRSIYDPDIPQGPRLPFPLLAAGALVLISFILFIVYKKSNTNGLAVALFFLLYGVYRFLIEFIRDEPFRLFIGPFSYGQWFAILCFPVGIVLLIFFTHKTATPVMKKN
jgi:phosphatidylglycerol:prolipoprotein diacylglycerol transferase